MPDQAILLVRLSDVRDASDERGLDGQISDGYAYAARLGWGIGPRATHVIVENTETGDTARGVSAFKRRKITVPGSDRPVLRTVRPGFRRALDMLHDQRADGLIALDLDRAMRDPRDLEDLIDVVEQSRPRIPVESVTGSLRLNNDADITMARVMCAMANKSSRDTVRRVSRMRLTQATEGTFGGGPRRFGFEKDGVTLREAEAAEIRRATGEMLAGVSLRQITASLRDRQVPTVRGGQWTTVAARDILLRPRNAGLMVYRANDPSRRRREVYEDADIVGRGTWEPIITEAQWRAVRAVLTDPARRSTPGNTPRWLGSGIYQCGLCDDGSTVRVSQVSARGGRKPQYQCYPSGQRSPLPPGRTAFHLARNAERTDEWVEANVKHRLQQPDAAALLEPVGPAVDMTALRTEEASLAELAREQTRLHARRVITYDQLIAGATELNERLAQIRAAIAAAESSSPLAGIAGRPDAADIWDSYDLGMQRAVLRMIATVTLLPTYRGAHFRTESVVVDFRRPSYRIQEDLARARGDRWRDGGGIFPPPQSAADLA